MTISIAALTGQDFQPQKVGQMKCYFAEITFDSSYPTGGEVLDPDDVGMAKILDVYFSGPAGGYVPEWDRANGKILMRGGAASGVLLAEAADTTNMSSIVVHAMIFGE